MTIAITISTATDCSGLEIQRRFRILGGQDTFDLSFVSIAVQSEINIELDVPILGTDEDGDSVDATIEVTLLGATGNQVLTDSDDGSAGSPILGDGNDNIIALLAGDDSETAWAATILVWRPRETTP